MKNFSSKLLLSETPRKVFQYLREISQDLRGLSQQGIFISEEGYSKIHKSRGIFHDLDRNNPRLMENITIYTKEYPNNLKKCFTPKDCLLIHTEYSKI